MTEERDAALARIFAESADVLVLGLEQAPEPLRPRAHIEPMADAAETPGAGRLFGGVYVQLEEGAPLAALARAMRQCAAANAPIVMLAQTHRPVETGFRRWFGALRRGPTFQLEDVCEALLLAQLSDLRAERLRDGGSLVWARA